ncbi:MAG TPA: thioredoxin-like domain-containing protein [Chthoniobacteraceae bacterium]|nr:thioredoxin-like domain-containing protein [Chthoniobacteraceae bacterium]
MNRWIALPALLLALALGAVAAPMTFKELDFLVRQRTPEADIVVQAQKRRLLVPLDEAAISTLKQNGAADSLLKTLASSDLVAPPEIAAAELQRQAAQQARLQQSMAEDAAAHAALEQRRRAVADVNSSRGQMAGILEGKLVRLEGDQLKPISARDIADVRVFGLYYSAMWCGPCRVFTPKLVAQYKRLKQQYGNQFEIILVSRDRDQFNMQNYMKTEGMPWPAVKFGTVVDQFNRYEPSGIPWLVALNSAGEPMTKNGLDKKYIAPEKILSAIEDLLAKGMR